MPMQTGKSPFNFAKSLAAHALDETQQKADFTGPPPGISKTDGVAQLTDCYISTIKEGDDKGKPFFRAAGVVITPQKHTYTPQVWEGDNKTGGVKNLQPVTETARGRQTSIMVRLFDRLVGDGKGGKKTVTADQGVAEMANELRLLGIDTTPLAKAADPEKTLNTFLKALKESAPFFHFSTRAGKPSADYPNPMVFENWHGIAEGFSVNGQAGPLAGTKDQTGGANDNADGANDTAPGGTYEPPTEGDGLTDDLDELCGLAKQEGEPGEPARAKLEAMAVAAGMTAEDVTNAESWEAVVEAIRAGGTGGEGGSEEWVPKVDEIYLYQVIDPKTKKPALDPKTKKPRKKVEVDIRKVDDKAKTVDALNNDDKKTLYKNVPWDQLGNE